MKNIFMTHIYPWVLYYCLAINCVKLVSRDNLKQFKFFAWSACVRLVHSLVILRARGCQFHCLSSYALNVQLNCAEGYKTNLINLENTYFSESATYFTENYRAFCIDYVTLQLIPSKWHDLSISFTGNASKPDNIRFRLENFPLLKVKDLFATFGVSH